MFYQDHGASFLRQKSRVVAVIVASPRVEVKDRSALLYATKSQLFALWAAIGETSGDPETGVKLGAEPRFERYDATQIAAVCSRTFRDALQRIARCKILTCRYQLAGEPKEPEHLK